MTKRFFQETFINDETDNSLPISLINRPIVKCRNLASRFEALRLQLSNIQYYDPFQKEQQSEEEEFCIIERPAKRQRSIVSTIVDNVIHGLLYSAASVYEYVWAESVEDKYREKVNARTAKKTTHNKKMRGQGVDYNHHSFFNLKQQNVDKQSIIRDTFLRTQRAALSKNNKWNPDYYTTVNSARRLEETWGLVDKKNYDVDFLPTKPLRNVSVQSLGLFGNQIQRSATM